MSTKKFSDFIAALPVERQIAINKKTARLIKQIQNPDKVRISLMIGFVALITSVTLILLK